MPQKDQTIRIRDHREQPWFWIDNQMFDDYAVKMGPRGVYVYCALARYADNVTQSCYPSLTTLSKSLGMRRATVHATLLTLERLGLIRITRRLDPAGDPTSNQYTLITPGGSTGSVPPSTVGVLPDKDESNQEDKKLPQEEVVRPPYYGGTPTVLGVVRPPYRNNPLSINKTHRTTKKHPSLSPLNTHGTPQRLPASPSGGARSGFEEFWQRYPRKVGKGAALKVWQGLKPSAELQARMAEAITAQCRSTQWQRDGGQFIPHPATWLRQERWEDECSPVVSGYFDRVVRELEEADAGR